jgi:hypothetical protein
VTQAQRVVYDKRVAAAATAAADVILQTSHVSPLAPTTVYAIPLPQSLEAVQGQLDADDE